MSKKNRGNKSQTTVSFIMPARDQKLIEGMNRLMNLFTRHCSNDPYVIEKATEIFKEYISEEEQADYIRDTLAKAEAAREEQRRKYEEAEKMAKENFEEFDTIDEDLTYIPDDGIEFEFGKYKLTKDGHILSKAKGWKPMTLVERNEFINIEGKPVLWNDYEFTGTINSVSTKISLRILVHYIALCIKNNKPVELDRDKVISIFYRK